jgi:hypothetical protein
VRRLLGWTTPELARKIWVGSSSLNDLVAGEFVLFNAYITCRLAPPISSFFLLLLEKFGLQLQHLTPYSVLLVSIFTHFMEMFVGVRPCVPIFRHFYALVGTGRSKCVIPTTSRFGTGCPAPTSALSPAPSGRTGAMTGCNILVFITIERYFKATL